MTHVLLTILTRNASRLCGALLFTCAAAARAQTPVGLGGGGATGGPVITANGVMFVGCDMLGIYRSTDAGKDWTLLDTKDIVSGADGLFSVAADPANPKHVIAFHPFQGVKESWEEGANGTWRKYRPAASWPSGLAVTSAAISGDEPPTVLLGTNDGVYAITRNAADPAPSWQALGKLSQPVLKVLFVADATRANRQHAFAATPAGIYSLDEAGSAWTALSPSGWPGAVTDLVGASDSGRYVLYAAAGRTSVYRYDSGKRGAGWQQLRDPDRCFQPNLLGMAQNALDIVYATSASGSCRTRAVFRAAIDSGQTRWTSVYDVANVSGGWMEKAEGYGRGWGFGGPPRGFAVHPRNPNIALATNLGGVYVTIDGGKRWTERYTTPADAAPDSPASATNGLDVTTVWNHYRRGSRTFLANTDIGLAVRDADSGWIPISSDGWTNWNTFYELAIDDAGGRIWAAVSQEHDIPHDTELDDAAPRNRTGAVLVSVDGAKDRAGRRWDRMRPGRSNSPLPPGPVVSVLYQAPYLYASVWGAGVFRSLPDASGGGDWTRWGEPGDGSNAHFYQLRADDRGNVHVAVAAAKSSVRCSHGAGSVTIYRSGVLYQLGPSPASTWISLTAALPSISPVDFTFDPAHPGTVYLATRDTRAGDPKTCKGSSWVGARGIPTGGLWRLEMEGLAVRATQVLSIETPDGSGSGPIANPEYQGYLEAFSPVFIGSTLYVATVGHGVLRSFDLGKTWHRAFPALPFLATQRLGLDGPGALFVTTFGGGAWMLFSPSW